MANTDARPTVLVIGPVPPPAFGVAKATRLIVDSPVLAERLRIVHLDTSDRLGFAKMGNLNYNNLRLGLKHLGQLVRLLRSERPAVALFTASQGKFALMRDGLFASVSRAHGVRTVTYLRGSGYAQMRASQGWLAAVILRTVVKHSARVLVLGDGLISMAHAVYGKARVAVVRNGCPPAVPNDQVGLREASHPVIIYIGRLSREKGLNEALEAARTVAADIPSLEFVLRGGWDAPAYRAEVEALVRDYALVPTVRFPGPASIDEKATELARAWALVVPSHSEGQPWVILEAMSAGVPVVATDTGAVPETVFDGVSGFVVPVRDGQALADRLVALLTDDDLWKRMSLESVQRYKEHFTLERSHGALADQLLQVIRGD